MITTAAIWIKMKDSGQDLIIPCHRHGDGFYILKLFGYKPTDYTIVNQGFLDENHQFLNRVDAYRHAVNCNQISYSPVGLHELFSEDLW